MTGRVFAIVLGLVAALSAIGGPAGAASPAQQPPPTDFPAVRDFGGCLSNPDSQGELIILLDESGSLRESDPGGARVTAAAHLLRRLADPQADGGRLDVAIAAFSSGFHPTSDWRRLDGSSLPGLLADVEAYRTRTAGFETDYFSALEGARRTLADRARADPGRQHCQAVAWFSDGRLDIPARDTPQLRERYGTTKPYAEGLDITSAEAAGDARQRAQDALCAPGGLADQLRGSRVHLFGIGLAAGAAQPSDFGLMRAIATGEPGPAGACGTASDPRPGEFLLASGIDELLQAFDVIGPEPPLVTEGGVCPRQPCEEGKHRFVLDSSIRSVHVLGSVDRPGVDAYLVPPSGTPIPLADRTIDRATVISTAPLELSYSWLSPRSVSIDMSAAPGAADWPGEWAVVFVDPSGSADGRSRANIHIASDLRPAWTNQADVVLHSGDRVPGVVLGVVDAGGAPVDPRSILGELGLSAQLVRPDGQRTDIVAELDKTRIGGPVELDLTAVPPGAATLRLVLAVTTAPATRPDGTVAPGTALAPQVVDLPLQVASPIGYPQVAPDVDFGRGADGSTELDGALQVTGPGCVWLQAPPPGVAPPSAGRVGVSAAANSPETCLDVPDGAKTSLPLRLSTERPGNGTVTGVLPIAAAPRGEPGRAQQIDVRYTADLRTPLEPTTYWFAFVAALLLGPGIPLGLLYLVKWLTSRIPTDRTLLAGVFPVSVEDGRIREPISVETLFRSGVLTPHNGRHLAVGDVELRARWWGSPFGGGFVTAQDRRGWLAASSMVPASRRGDRQALLPLAVHGSWVVLHRPGSGPFADVLLLVAGDSDEHSRAALDADLRARLPDVLARLQAHAPAAQPRPAGTVPGHQHPDSGGTHPPSPPERAPFRFDSDETHHGGHR